MPPLIAFLNQICYEVKVALNIRLLVIQETEFHEFQH